MLIFLKHVQQYFIDVDVLLYGRDSEEPTLPSFSLNISLAIDSLGYFLRFFCKDYFYSCYTFLDHETFFSLSWLGDRDFPELSPILLSLLIMPLRGWNTFMNDLIITSWSSSVIYVY